jgi:hypothetical protein
MQIAPIVNNWHTGNSATTATSSTHPQTTAVNSVTLATYKKALAIILSRAFQGRDDAPYLCPAIDMLNAQINCMDGFGDIAIL